MAPERAWWKEMSRYQWLVLIVAWLGWVFDIFDTALFNFTKIPMLHDLLGEARYKEIGPVIEGQIQATFVIGWAIGGFLFGVLADKVGRTKVLVWTILIYCALTGLTSLCQSYEQVLVIRFLTAIGIGGEWAAGAALIAEVVPNRARASAASLLQTAAAIGPMLAAYVTSVMMPLGWRSVYLVGIIPALLTILIRMGVKEPESWVDSQKERAQQSPVKEVLINPKWRRHLIVAMLIGLVGVAGAGNISFWMPNLVKGTFGGLEPSGPELAARTAQVTYAQHMGTLVGVFVFPWLCTIWSRKAAFGAFFLTSLGALAISLFRQPGIDQLMIAAPVLSCLTIGLTSGFALYFPELFPTHLRATGCSFAYNVARIFQAPLPWLTGLMIQAAPQQSVATGMLVAGGLYAVGLVALIFAPETKGQPLPE